MSFDIIWNYALFQLAGVWTILIGYGTGAVLIVGFLAAAHFSPVFKKDFLWAAVVVAVYMAGYLIGVHQGEKRVQAQWDFARSATIAKSKKARLNAEHSVDRKPSRWMSNNRDVYDRDGQ